MGEKLIQGAIIGVVAIAAAVVIAWDADGWADYVVMGAFLVLALGFAIAVSPRLYARRRRTISRSSEGGSR
jgi:membrane protein implicated in regulation of membrane protease activity